MKNSAKVLLLLGIVALSAQPLWAIQVTVHGKNGSDTLVQGDTARWVISGIPTGATVVNQIVMDVDSSGTVGPSDIELLSFSETDGVSTSDGPNDSDGIANGVITTMLPLLAFPVGHYIFVSINGTDTARVVFVSVPCPSSTYTISGTVTFYGGAPAPKILIQASPNGIKGAWFALTSPGGSYTMATNIHAGTQLRMGVMDNTYSSGYMATPSDSGIVLNGNVTGFNFVLTPGKIITGHVYDTLGNPLSDISVSANNFNGSGNGQGTKTDANGRYELAVMTGNYQVQFGDQNDTLGMGKEGYLITYYNQKYVSWLFDTVKVNVDTVKNIDDTLKRGGIIMGRVTYKGSGPASFCVQVYPYNTTGNPSFTKCFSTQYGYAGQGYYQVGVLPGNYTVQFTVDTGGIGPAIVFYDQSPNPPGTAVTVTAINDTAKSINADISPISVKENAKPLLRQFALNRIFPNPFHGSATISYSIQRQSRVTLSVYNAQGREVKTLVNTVLSAGAYQAVFPGENFPSGVYLVKLSAGAFTAMEKISLIKKSF